MRSFSGQQGPRLPISWATLIAFGCGISPMSCDSEPTRRSASRATTAPSTQPVLRAERGAGSSAAEPAGTPSPSAVAPKEAHTIEEERCSASSADCLPEPYNRRADMVVGTLTGAPYSYDAARKRYPLPDRTTAEGGCEHDGDCLARATCVACVSRFRVPPPRQCSPLYRQEFDGAFCGCVEKRCQWFTQRLTQRVITSTQSLQVQLGGAPATDAKLLSEAARLFDLDLANCYYPRKNLLPARHRFVMTVGKYGEAEATVSGSHPSVRKCVSDVFHDMTQEPNWIPGHFLGQGELRFTGVITVELAWAP